MQDYERGLALVAAAQYPAALAAFEAASQAGCGAASFELGVAYDWLYYGTYDVAQHGHCYPRSYSMECLKRAAQEQSFLPARAYLMTHEWYSGCVHSYADIYGEDALEADLEADEYVRLRLQCYGDVGVLDTDPSLADERQSLFDLCVARNLPIPEDLAEDQIATALIERLALRGMPWAQCAMGDRLEADKERSAYWKIRAARNGHFMMAFGLSRRPGVMGVEMFHCALYLDWFASRHRRLLHDNNGGLITVAHMRRRYYYDRRAKPLTPAEIYCFGRAAHLLLVEDGEEPGEEPIRPSFEFWHKLGNSYRDCMSRARSSCIAFMVAAMRQGMPRDVARYIAHHHIWPQRAQTATHKTYGLRKTTKGKRRRK